MTASSTTAGNRAPILAPLACATGAAISVLAPMAMGDPAYNRARLTIWVTLLLVAPAIALIPSWGRGGPLPRAWLSWWSAAFAMFLLHMVWGFGIAFDGNVLAVIAVQGVVVGAGNFLLALLWGASVAVAWTGGRALWLHAAASLLLVVAAIGSTLVFGHWPSSLVGGVVLLAVAVAAWTTFRPRTEA